MTTSAAPEVKQVPVIGVAFTIDLDPGKKLVLQTHVDSEASISEFNAVLDKLANAGQRMEKRFLIPAVEKSIQVCQREMERGLKDLAKLDLAFETKTEIFAKDKKRGEPPKEDQKSAERRQALLVGIEEFRDKVKTYTAELADLKKEAYGGVDVSTDLRASS